MSDDSRSTSSREKKTLTSTARKRKSVKLLQGIIDELEANNTILQSENSKLKQENQRLIEAMQRMSNGEDRRSKRLEALEERNRMLEKIAHHDSLTGSLNRLGMEVELDKTIKMINREHGKGTLVYMDLDKFKLINDIIDHRTGDYVLSSISSILSKHLRPNDLISRVGGDEFLVFLQDIEIPTAKKVVDKIQGLVQAITIEHPNLSTLMSVADRDCLIDFSTGYLEVKEGCEYSFTELMNLAEKDVPKFRARRSDITK